MGVSIGLVANVYNEANALPGWLECHIPFFDDVRVLHAGPQGTYSDDGTLEILEDWKVPVEFCAIDEGFGVVRTRALRMSPCEYVMLLDADERFYATSRILGLSGTATSHAEVDNILRGYDFSNPDKPPDWGNLARLGAGLVVDVGGPYNAGELLRNILEERCPDVVHTVRRHWHDFSMRRPTQSWFTDPDWQARLVRNDPAICFDPATRMHERLMGATNPFVGDAVRGPFFDHFHFTFKRMEHRQRAHDVAIYDCIHAGKVPPTKGEFWRK